MSAPTLRKPLPNTATAQLPIAGIIPFSATDWPGKLTATAFTQGCPLRCVYCHNPQLQAFTPGARSLAEFLSLLNSRHGLIDAAVISGGEPTSVHGLARCDSRYPWHRVPRGDSHVWLCAASYC